LAEGSRDGGIEAQDFGGEGAEVGEGGEGGDRGGGGRMGSRAEGGEDFGAETVWWLVYVWGFLGGGLGSG
jgi:hypothetical protein